VVDRVLAIYVVWRETTGAIADSYRRWSVAPAGEQASRLAAYIAAVDQEQTAAAVYVESISELERWLPDPDPGSTLWLSRGPG
jgi:hypothetical protein